MVKPEWLKIRPPTTEKFSDIKTLVRDIHLHTVCQESHCPNMSECWSSGTATFLVLGDTCTRACRFCNTKTAAKGEPLDPEEPKKIADTLKKWDLEYIVITSVDRDDLPDQGAAHFAACIREAKRSKPDIRVEVLIPDFKGNEKCLDTIIRAGPDVISHNIEVVEKLQRIARDRRANYKQSLKVLEYVKKKSKIYTKSSLMVGLGEKDEDVIKAMKDLRYVGASFLTIGQYLKPGEKNLEIKEYVRPEKFDFFKKEGKRLGFMYVASGPFVRSSYKAGELFMKTILK